MEKGKLCFRMFVTGGAGLFLLLIAYIGFGYVYDCYTSEAVREKGMLLTCLTVMFCIFLAAVGKAAERYAGVRLERALFLGILVVQAILIFAVYSNNLPWSDTLSVLSEAMNMLEREKAQIHSAGGYFEMYGNNYGVTVAFYYYFRLLSALGITSYWTGALVLNAAALDLSAWFCVHLVKLLFGAACALRLLLVCACSPLLYLFLPFAYSNTLSMPFLMGIFYFAARVYREQDGRKRIALGIAGGTMAAVGYVIRVTTAIGILALVIGISFSETKRYLEGNKKAALAAAAAAAVVIFSLNGFVFSHTQRELQEKNFPAAHWLMMGLGGDGSYSGEDEAFTRGFPSKAEKQQANRQEILERIQAMTLPDAWELFLAKTARTWAEGMGGLSSENAYFEGYSPANRFLSGDKRDFAVLYYHTFQLGMLAFSVEGIFIQMYRREKGMMWLVTLALFGFLCFYSIWEANSRYALSVYWLLCLESWYGIEGLLSIERKFPAYRAGWNIGIGSCLLAVCAIFAVGIFQYRKAYTEIPVEKREYILKSEVRSFHEGKISDIYEEGRTFSQTFYAGRAFNEIEFFVRWTGKQEWDTQELTGQKLYLFTLQDQNGRTLYEEAFGVELVGGYHKTVRFPTVHPEGEERFIVEIQANPACEGNIEDTVEFVYFDLGAYDYIKKGELSLDGTALEGDLVFSVSEYAYGPYMEKNSYLLVGLFLCAGSFLPAAAFLGRGYQIARSGAGKKE